MNFYKISDKKLTEIETQFGVQVVSPIMGNGFSAKEYFDPVLPLYNQAGKLISPSELGCALSHISIYETIVSTNLPGIIFESDISGSKTEFEEAVRVCADTSADFIHLGWHPEIASNTYFKGVKSENNEMYIVETLQNFYGAFAYYVSVNLAKELLEYHKQSIKLADSWAIFFLNSTTTPYFKPIFTHPPTRNEMHTERLSVNGNVYNIDLNNISFFLKKLILQQVSKMKFWKKEIKPR